MQKIISGYFILSLSKTYIVEGHISDGECETWCGRRYWPRAAIREVIFSTFFKTDFPKRLSKTYIAEGLIYQARISVMVYVNLAIMKSRWLRTSPLCTGIKIWGNFLETLKNRLSKTLYMRGDIKISQPYHGDADWGHQSRVLILERIFFDGTFCPFQNLYSRGTYISVVVEQGVA